MGIRAFAGLVSKDDERLLPLFLSWMPSIGILLMISFRFDVRG